MDVLRTPDERFNQLESFSFEPQYTRVNGLRVHYIDEGPITSAPVLMLHGEPTWSYLYRRMVPILAAAGHRVIVPDLVGFGRSDKPVRQEEYTYQRHVDWILGVVENLDLQAITLVCQDWGGLIGLRIAAEHAARFARIVAANTFLPTGDQDLGEAFHRWRAYSQDVPEFPIGRILQRGTVRDLESAVVAAYEAPFPDESYKAGARIFPMLVPCTPEDPACRPNRAAWDVLSRWDKPFLTAFSDQDPITRGGDKVFQAVVPGAAGRPHATIAGAGHFLQEDKGTELAAIVARFIQTTA